MSDTNLKKRILLIDDDTDDRELFSEALATVDPVAACDHATDGAEALDRLRKREISEPNLIFLDINMPIMNGWQFLSELRNEEAYRHIPVIVYSTSSNQRDKLKADDLGALCFITKPHAFRKLRDMLGVVMMHLIAGNYKSICKEMEAIALS